MEINNDLVARKHHTYPYIISEWMAQEKCIATFNGWKLSLYISNLPHDCYYKTTNIGCDLVFDWFCLRYTFTSIKTDWTIWCLSSIKAICISCYIIQWVLSHSQISHFKSPGNICHLTAYLYFWKKDFVSVIGITQVNFLSVFLIKSDCFVYVMWTKK